MDFPAIDLEPDERCGLVSDVIPAGTMTSGMFQYELRVLGTDRNVASARRDFVALDLE